MSEFTYRPSNNVAFVVRNNSKKKIRIFTYPLEPGQQRDLMKIPNISEEDIRASALKGQLQFMISIGQISIISSDIDLVQFNSSQQTFLQNAGASAGVQTYVQCANVTELEATNDSEMTTGTLAVTTTLGDFFLDKTSTATVDHITILSTRSGSGRWVRKNTKLQTWINQNTWYIDPVSGNDENTGLTDVTALKTFGERRRRIAGHAPPRDSIVTLLNDCSEDFIIDDTTVGDPTFTSTQITVKGILTTVVTGTVTATQAMSKTAAGVGADGTVTDSGQSSANFWTAHVNRMIVLTGGTNSGAVAWILKDLGTKQCRHSPFYNPNTFSRIDPAVNDTYKICTVPKLTGSPHIGGYCTIQNLHFDSTCVPFFDRGIDCFIVGCRMSSGTVNSANFLLNSLLDTTNLYVFEAQVLKIGLCGIKIQITSYGGGYLHLTDWNIFSDVNNPLSAFNGGTLDIEGPTGFFGSNSGGGTGIILAYNGPGVVRIADVIFGTGNGATTALLYVSGTKIFVTGAATLPNNLANMIAYAQIGSISYTLAQLQAQGVTDLGDGGSVVIAGLYSGNTIPVAKVFFGANALATTATTVENIPPGGGAATASTSSVAGVVCAGKTTVSSFYVAMTGSGSNVGGQTIAFKLLKNGSQIGSTVTIAANASANTTSGLSFAPVALVAGDILRVTATPSNSLTAVTSDIMVSVI